MGADVNPHGRWRWPLSVVGAFGLLGVGLTIFQGLKVPPERPKIVAISGARSQSIELRQIDDGVTGLNEEALLFDPTPLFLPTKWNAAQSTVSRREPTGAFDLTPPELRLKGRGLDLQLLEPVSGPEIRDQAKSTEAQIASLDAFGRSDAPVGGLAKRDVFVEVFVAGTGQKVFAQAISTLNLSGETLWVPLECVVSVGTAGLVGSVAITQRSGVEVVDNELQRYISQTLKLGERLAPGFYQIRVGP